MKTEYKFLLAGLDHRYDFFDATLEDIKRYCLSRYGGYTVMPCLSAGAWKDPETGKVHQDTHVTLFVALDHDGQAYDLERYLANLLNQIEIYCVKVGEVI